MGFTYLSQNCCQAHHPQSGAFTAHVRSSQKHYFLLVHVHVVWNKVVVQARVAQLSYLEFHLTGC